MILFSEILEQLEAAELSLSGIADKDTGLILKGKYNRIISLVNAALNDLYLKFTLRQSQCVILTQPNKYLYEITKANALSNNPSGFILDSVQDPFVDTVMEITAVRSIDEVSLSFNRQTQGNYVYDFNREGSFNVYSPNAVFKSPKQGVLRVPVGLELSHLIINYKSGPDKLQRIPEDQLANFDSESLILPIPEMFVMPIVFYCCSRIGNAKGNQRAGQSVFSEGSSFYSKYLSECANIQSNLSLANEVSEPIDNFRRQGFV